MNIFKCAIVGLSIIYLFTFSSCDKNGDFLIFGINQDKNLGQQVSQEIESSPADFPILPETGNEDAYTYIREMRDRILNSGEVTYKDDFVWQIKIINQDVLNAFATPGGYIYIYTGLIKFLDDADDLAGVMGHEIAHADQRHSSKQLQKQYGVSLLLEIALGNNAEGLKNVIGSLTSLTHSRNHESEADEFSVIYLSKTEYACNGAASFFEKLEAEDSDANPPAFLSTHPPDDKRISEINEKATELSCSTELITSDSLTYDDFKALF